MGATEAGVGHADLGRVDGQQAPIIWLTGLSGAGKTAIAVELREQLRDRGAVACVLDADNVRRGLCGDLGYSREERLENMRRATEAARLMASTGVFVIVSLISPYQAGRDAARARFAPGDFFEVHVDASPDVAAAREPRSIYREAQRAQAPGIDSTYERPPEPELRLDSTTISPHRCAEMIVAALQDGGHLNPAAAPRR